jgi:hypothetical protein
MHHFNTLIAIGYLSHALPSSFYPGRAAWHLSVIIMSTKLLLGSLRSPAYTFIQQINLPNCTISSLVYQIFLSLATLTLIQFSTTIKSNKLHHFNTLIAIGSLSHALPSSFYPGRAAWVISLAHMVNFKCYMSIKFVLGSLRSTSYHFRQQINLPNCTISSLVCQIVLRLATLAFIQF